jgi:hypothetical protein
MACWMTSIGPDQQLEGPICDSSDGRFYIVLDGRVSCGSEQLDRLSVIFASGDERGDMFSGQDGAQLLVLQFPAAQCGSA